MSSQSELRSQKASAWSWLEPDLSAVLLFCAIGLLAAFNLILRFPDLGGSSRNTTNSDWQHYHGDVDPHQSPLSGRRCRSKWLLRLGTAVPASARRPWSNRVSSGGLDLGRFRLLVRPAYRSAAISAGEMS